MAGLKACTTFCRRGAVRALLTLAVVGSFGVPVFAADGAISTWMSGTGPSAKTYVFKTHDHTFIGAVCGPCDDPSTVFPIAGGTATDDTHASFSIVGGKGMPSKISLTRVDGEGSLEATVKSVAAPKTPR